jgi:hypothetical protein
MFGSIFLPKAQRTTSPPGLVRPPAGSFDIKKYGGKIKKKAGLIAGLAGLSKMKTIG